MAVNRYFHNGTTSEQDLFASLVRESIQIHGIDVYYIPRKILKRDIILNEDVISSFDNAYKIEMYIESVDGFEGDGKLLERFGFEVREECTFKVANCRWNELIGRHGYSRNSARPMEGDLIYMPLGDHLWEIRYADSKKPFYNLKDLNVYTLVCEKFEYESQEIDTGIEEIDDIQSETSQGFTFLVDSEVGEPFEEGETLIFELPTNETGSTEFFQYNNLTESSPYQRELKTGTLSFDDGVHHTIIPGTKFTSIMGGGHAIISKMRNLDDEQTDLFPNDHGANNVSFSQEVNINDFIDFSEKNPFGEPFNYSNP